MTKSSFLLCVLCTALWAGEWSFTPPLSQEGDQLIRVRLTPEEIARLGERAEWLRLRDQSGREVPFALSTDLETTWRFTESVLSTEITQLRTQDDGTVEILCGLRNGVEAPEELTVRFSTRVRDFEEQVQIFGETTDGWKPLCTDGFIFDSSRLLSLQKLTVSFHREKCRKFRILLSQANFEIKNALRHIVDSESSTTGTTHTESTDLEVRDFKMEGIEFIGIVKTFDNNAPRLMPLPVRSLVQDSRSQGYIVTPRFYPVYGLELDSDSSNFSRRLFISQRAFINASYSHLADATINRLRLNGYSQEQTSVRFPLVNQGDLRIEFESGMAIPLRLTAASCLSPCYSLEFIGNAKDAPYHLVAQEEGDLPHYDIGGILQFGKEKITSQTTTLSQCGKFLGASYERQAKSPVVIPKKTNLRWLLMTAVGVAILAMTFALAKVIRNTAPPKQ